MAHHKKQDVEALLKARAEIEEQLRRHKSTLTVLFTDIVGSTSFFENNGDTAGLAMVYGHDQLATSVVEHYGGRVVKTIGDSAMAEFSDAVAAVRAAVELERQILKLNQSLPEKRVLVRIGIHSGAAYRKGNDLFGDVVNVAARIVKRAAPSQILVSRSVFEEVSKEGDLQCKWLNKFNIDGRMEKEDVFEITWTNSAPSLETSELTEVAEVEPKLEVGVATNSLPQAAVEMPSRRVQELNHPVVVSSRPPVSTANALGPSASMEENPDAEKGSGDLFGEVAHAARSLASPSYWRSPMKTGKEFGVAVAASIALAVVVTFVVYVASLRKGPRAAAAPTTLAVPTVSPLAGQSPAPKNELASIVKAPGVSGAAVSSQDADDDWTRQLVTPGLLDEDPKHPSTEQIKASTRSTSKAAKHDKTLAQQDAKLRVDDSSRIQAQGAATPTPTLNLQNAQPSISQLSSQALQKQVSADVNNDRANATAGTATNSAKSEATGIYFEVGSFKDERWADTAIDKLTRAGFHAILIHKSILWSESFHVQVGPYGDADSIEAAREKLLAEGYKLRVAN